MPDPPGYGLHQPRDASAGNQARARNRRTLPSAGSASVPARPGRHPEGGVEAVEEVGDRHHQHQSPELPLVVVSRVLVPGGEGWRPVMIMAFTVADGAITAIRTLTDSDRLAQVVPSWVT